MKNALSEKARCPTHCEYWTYDSMASFSYLENPSESQSSARKYMCSKIHVYYTDFGYRQHKAVKEKTIYTAFCDLGSLAGLYWGMSIISFFHVFFYVPRYLIALRRARQAGRRVAPAPGPRQAWM